MAIMASAAITIDSAGALRLAPRQIRILTVDGHELVQEGLAAMINREGNMNVVVTASERRYERLDLLHAR
jgi:hypothetical protein